MQAGIGDGFKTPVDLMNGAGTGIEGLNAVFNGPLNGRIESHVEMQIFDVFGAAPITADEMAVFDQQHGQRHGPLPI